MVETVLRLPSVSFPWSLAVHHQSLAFCARLYDKKNEAPEEEAGEIHGTQNGYYFMYGTQIVSVLLRRKQLV